MVNVNTLAALAAGVALVDDIAEVAADPAVRKSATRAWHDVLQAGRSIADLGTETAHAWRRVRTNRRGGFATQPA